MEITIKQDSNGNKLTLQIVEGKIRIAITDNEIGMAVDLNDQEIENLIKCVKPDTKEEIEQWKAKAEKWDQLGEKIDKCYPEYDDDGNELESEGPDADLCTIGELAAHAYGWL